MVITHPNAKGRLIDHKADTGRDSRLLALFAHSRFRTRQSLGVRLAQSLFHSAEVLHRRTRGHASADLALRELTVVQGLADGQEVFRQVPHKGFQLCFAGDLQVEACKAILPLLHLAKLASSTGPAPMGTILSRENNSPAFKGPRKVRDDLIELI